MSETILISKPAARQRFDLLCQEKNEAMPTITVTRIVNINGKTVTQEYKRNTKAISDGAQNTGKAMIQSFAYQFARAVKNLGTEWFREGDIPSLRTNGTKMAIFRGSISSRTIRNHIRELKSIGFITDSKFHGSKADFELWISPQILFGDALSPFIAEAGVFEKTSTQPPVFQDTNGTNFPHRHPVSIELIETKHTTTRNVDKSPLLRRQENGNSHSQTENLSERQSSQKMETNGGGGGRNISVDNNPKTWINELHKWKAPGTNQDFTALRRHEQHYVSELWQYAKKALWSTQVFIPQENFQALDAITMSVYKPVFNKNLSEKALNKFHRTQLKAIDKAAKFYQKSQSSYPGHPYSKFKAGQGYFDSENSFGFKVAQRWAEKDAAANHERYGEKILTKAIRHIKNHPAGKSPQEFKHMSSLEVFRHYEAKLKSFGTEIQQDYYKQVSTLSIFR